MRSLSIAVTSIFAAGLAFAARGASAEGPIGTNGGPQVGFRGCIYYQDSGFRGAHYSITGGTKRRYVGDWWNDRISSFACNRDAHCQLDVYQDRDFRGEHQVFYRSLQYVGDWWNDRISSMIARCGDSKDFGGE